MAAPIKITKSYLAAGVAPHGTTQRWSYTVPAGRRAIVELMSAETIRDGASGAPARAANFFTYTPSGVAATFPLEAGIDAGALGEKHSVMWGGKLVMHAADVMAGSTADASTGGTLFFNSAFVASEFDA